MTDSSDDIERPTPPEIPSALAAQIAREISIGALVVAREEIGHGEDGGNNRGRWVREYRRGADDGEPWCAAFVSWCFEESAERLGHDLAIGRAAHSARWRGHALPFRRTHGAKRLTERVADSGRWIVEPRRRGAPLVMSRQLELDPPRAGDVICWHRATGGSGHVAIVERFDADDLVWIEGNAGAYPSLVRRRSLPYRRWAADLYAIARLV